MLTWMNNLEQQKGKFNPCSIDLWGLLSFVPTPHHHHLFRSIETPSLVHASLGTLDLNLPWPSGFCTWGSLRVQKFEGYWLLKTIKYMYLPFSWWHKFRHYPISHSEVSLSYFAADEINVNGIYIYIYIVNSLKINGQIITGHHHTCCHLSSGYALYRFMTHF